MNGTGEGGKGQERKWIKEICEWGRGEGISRSLSAIAPKNKLLYQKREANRNYLE